MLFVVRLLTAVPMQGRSFELNTDRRRSEVEIRRPVAAHPSRNCFSCPQGWDGVWIADSCRAKHVWISGQRMLGGHETS